MSSKGFMFNFRPHLDCAADYLNDKSNVCPKIRMIQSHASLEVLVVRNMLKTKLASA